MSTSSVVREFFVRYVESRNTFDPVLSDSKYPDKITVAGPAGARVAEKAAVLAGLVKGRELLKTLGHKTTKLTALQETTVDEHYAIVRAQFVWRFEKAHAQPIDVELDSTFVLYVKDGAPQIIVQHEHEDFQQALRARGVLPAQA